MDSCRAAASGSPIPEVRSDTHSREAPSVREQEHVRVSDELSFVWHRPPMAEVERQWADREVARILVNGCFDLMHVGHFNILRQAKCMFYQKKFKKVVLVAGLHSDEGITGVKGPPLLSEEERLGVLRATKWVDELVTGLPYVSMTAAMADHLRVDWICHGDDMPLVPSGNGMYSNAIAEGRFQLLKRTEGISTTNILQRLLCRQSASEPSDSASLACTLATTQRLAQFAAPGDLGAARSLHDARRVVYIGGTFDLLHVGHVRALERAAALGDFLLVGLHSDAVAQKHQGEAPILTLLERAMAVLSLRFVDDVVLDAPWEVGHELLATMNVAVVASGRSSAAADGEEERAPRPAKCARFEKPRSMGMVVEVESGCPLSTRSLKLRCLERKGQLASRNVALVKKELAYVEGKQYVPEA